MVADPGTVRVLHPQAGAPRTLAALLAADGLLIEQRCGGDAGCGSCRVALHGGAFVIDGKLVRVQPPAALSALACRTEVAAGPATVGVPPRTLLSTETQVDSDYELPPSVALDPPVRRCCVELAPVRLGDRGSDIERLHDALQAQGAPGPIEVPLPALQDASRLFDAESGCLSVTLAARPGRWELADVAPGRPAGGIYGVAFDIGTTTVAGQLVDLATGRTLGQAGALNRQVVMAADVAARISAARGAAQGQRAQRLVVRETLEPLLEQLCRQAGIAKREVHRFSVAGHTVMLQLLLALQVRRIGRIPFAPTTLDPAPIPASLLGLMAHPRALVDVLPGAGGYVGADIVADLHHAGIAHQPDGTLLLDIGTNAEIVLVHGGELLACAAPAGPAFEGGGLMHGCRAVPGAIARLNIDATQQLAVQTIGGGAACGLCGSAVIDFLAQGYRNGWIEHNGRLRIEHLRALGRYRTVTLEGRTVHACVLATPAQHEPVLVTEADLAEVLKAKAAVAAGVHTLLELSGRRPADIPRLLLAGGFARQLDVGHAMAVGLLPTLPGERVHKLGNAALGGAVQALIDRHAVDAMRRLRRLVRVVELNRVPSFEGQFIDQLRLPPAPGSAA